MIYFYNDIDATNSIRISNSEIAELDLVAKIKESDLDKYLKKYLKKDTDVWFYYDLSDLAEDYDCQYVQNDEFGLWYTDENKKYPDIWKKSIKESVEFSKEKDIYIAQIKDSSISFAYTPIDTNGDFNGFVVFDGDDAIEYLNWKGADANDMLKAFDDFEKAVKKHSSKEDAKLIIKDFHDKLGI